ncbi:TnsD family Tn7-like transposition protein [Gorillibacterium massiliense]|uniref:TnsD family Tn7-like transposition protein n=1 Tax=Gorillibacterium massiliense TaxID=1280390 RepID=UPI0005937C02
MEIYQDEILVSALARRANTGDKRIKPSIRRLFGFGHKKASVDLPSSIGMLTANKVFTMSNEQLIQDHTIYPLFHPFISEAQATKVFTAMINGRGSGIHLTAGIMASVVRHKQNLKLCPGCVYDDYTDYGEPYWHINHQLPGMLVCSKHFDKLISYCSVCGVELTVHNESSLPLCPSHCRYGHDLAGQAVKMHDDKAQLLSCGITRVYELGRSGALNHRNFHQVFQHRLIQLGLCSSKGRVEQAQVFQMFNRFYSSELLSSIGVPSPIGVESWLVCILRVPRRSFHPLLHILVILCLWQDVDRFMDDYTNVKERNTSMYKRCSPVQRRTGRSGGNRVDWGKRDKNIARSINNAILELRSSLEKPDRLTVLKIGKRINQLALLERHLDKMPLSKAILDMNIESIEQNQIRKIEWAINTLILDGHVPVRWRVLRKAGIRVLASIEIDTYVDSKINEATVKIVA